MARAYIVVARNDVPDNLLQTLDIWPNKSLRNQTLDPAGQTHYNTWFLLDGINAAVTLQNPAAAQITIDGDVYGLSAYLAANLEDTANGDALTQAMYRNIATRIEGRAALGLPLTVNDINAIVAAESGSALDGFGLGDSRNAADAVEEILRILAGERFFIADNTELVNAGGAWTGVAGTLKGEFVLRPNVELPESVRGNNDEPIRGRNSFVGKSIPTTTAVQDTTVGQREDTAFNDVLAVVDTGRLQQSAINGALAEMASSTWTFQNPAFTYGGGATPAQTLGAANIGTDFAGRAVTVYAADGSVIV
jgi:hypothetical protein